MFFSSAIVQQLPSHLAQVFLVLAFKLPGPELHCVHPRVTSHLMFLFVFGQLPCPAELEDTSEIPPGKQRCHGHITEKDAMPVGKKAVCLLCEGCLERVVESKVSIASVRNQQLEPAVLLWMHVGRPTRGQGREVQAEDGGSLGGRREQCFAEGIFQALLAYF